MRPCAVHTLAAWPQVQVEKSLRALGVSPGRDIRDSRGEAEGHTFRHSAQLTDAGQFSTDTVDVGLWRLGTMVTVP